MADDRPSVLVIAYVCSPTMGTEPGAGWGLITALGTFANVTVITGSRYIDEIRDWESKHPDAATRFVEVSDRVVGPWTRWHRIPEFVYYMTWLRRSAPDGTGAPGRAGLRRGDACHLLGLLASITRR